MSGPHGVVSVRAEVAASLLIDGLHQEAVRRAPERLPADVERRLAGAAQPPLARLGYLARVIERERFAPANQPAPWLADHLTQATGEDPVATVAAALADEEPAGKPAPADGVPSWRIPGPGGHVRHFLALRAVGDASVSGKRSWMYGFFVRCCHEIAPLP